LTARLQESIKHEYAIQIEQIKSSIKHENDQHIELFKRNLDKRQKVEIVAELLSVWLAVARGETTTKEHRTRMNLLSFQATIWLPEKLAQELSKTLQDIPNAMSYSELLIFARQELSEKDGLTPLNVTYWPSSLEKQSRPRRLSRVSKPSEYNLYTSSVNKYAG
jgi:hypothetical protein